MKKKIFLGLNKEKIMTTPSLKNLLRIAQQKEE